MGLHSAITRWALAGLSAAGIGCSAAPPPWELPSARQEVVAAARSAPEPAAPPASSAADAEPPAAAAPAERAPQAPAERAPQAPAEPAPQAPAEPPAPFSVPPNTAVLHVGDSFAVAGFAQALRPRMEALHVRYAVKAETSSFTVTWAAKMEKVVANFQPDLVIINLGANEVANTDPPTHAPAVRRIIKAIGGRPCVWVSPPLWRKDTGIIDVIRTNSAPCRFFDSDALVPGTIPRQKDKIHPNDVGGARWAEAFWGWLQAEHLPLATEPSGETSRPRSPWSLRPSPPEEHAPRSEAAL
jgi:hypothetical protein